MPTLATLKKRAKNAFAAKQKASMKRRQGEALLEHLRQIEKTLKAKFKQALSDYEAKAKPEDSDLGSFDENSSEPA